MNRSGSDQKLVRRPPCSGVTSGAGWQENVSDLPATRSTLAPPLTGLTCGLQVIEGLHRAGVEFRALAEDFDVTTNLPFDEWTEVFGSERLTGALLDRLTHHVYILEMNGESSRLKRSRETAASQAPEKPEDA